MNTHDDHDNDSATDPRDCPCCGQSLDTPPTATASPVGVDWRTTPTGARLYRRWGRSGLSDTEIDRWIAAGVPDVWTRTSWRMTAGCLTPDAVAAWTSIGASDPAVVASFLLRGITPEQARAHYDRVLAADPDRLLGPPPPPPWTGTVADLIARELGDQRMRRAVAEAFGEHPDAGF